MKTSSYHLPDPPKHLPRLQVLLYGLREGDPGRKQPYPGMEREEHGRWARVRHPGGERRGGGRRGSAAVVVDIFPSVALLLLVPSFSSSARGSQQRGGEQPLEDRGHDAAPGLNIPKGEGGPVEELPPPRRGRRRRRRRRRRKEIQRNAQRPEEEVVRLRQEEKQRARAAPFVPWFHPRDDAAAPHRGEEAPHRLWPVRDGKRAPLVARRRARRDPKRWNLAAKSVVPRPVEDPGEACHGRCFRCGRGGGSGRGRRGVDALLRRHDPLPRGEEQASLVV